MNGGEEVSERGGERAAGNATGDEAGRDGDAIVVMGVSGCGKSTIAALLAARLGAHFRDGDEFHPPENVRKMSDGIPLTDEDREPWLEAVRDYAADAAREHGRCVIACSALKRRYRDTLGGGAGEAVGGDGVRTFYVFLQGSPELIASRMHLRTGHFMPENMLESQFETLESPIGEPRVIAVDITPEPEVIAAAAEAALRDHPEFDGAARRADRS